MKAAGDGETLDLIVWPESPSPFYTSDPLFQNAVSALARQAQTWVVAGSIGVEPAMHSGGQESKVFNSAALVSPQGEWVGRYDKVHLVPFGEYLPFPRLFAFAGGLTKEVGEFSRGTSRSPLEAGNRRLGVFICYESIFPDEVRQFAAQGAQVLVNISNDGWYGDSGAWKQHLQQTRDACHRERSLAAAYDQYGFDGGDRSRGKSGGAGSTQRTKRADGAVRADFRYHVLHAARRLVRISVCDNFSRRTAGALDVS